MATSTVDFITKQQFTAVHDHFRKVLDSEGESKAENLAVEFRLLLGYFQSAYEESERKTHKILQLMAESTKWKDKVTEVENQMRADSEESKVQFANLKRTLDKHVQQGHLLAKEISELKENIEELRKHPESDKSLKKYEHFYLQAKRSYNDVGVETEAFTAITSHKCKICSKRYSESERLKDIEIIQRRYENLDSKIKMLSGALRLSRKEVDNLKKIVEERNKQLTQIRDILEKEKDLTGDESEQKSLRAIIDGLLLEVKEKTRDVQNLQENFEKLLEDRNSVLLESQLKEDAYEDMKRKFASLQKDKVSVARKAGVFEKHLAEGRGHLFNVQSLIDSLKEEIQKLKNEIEEREIREKLQEPEQKTSDASQKNPDAPQNLEIVEQNKSIAFFKNQIAIRDRKIRNFKDASDEIQNKLTATRKLCRERKKEAAGMSVKLSGLKNRLSTQNEKLQNLTSQLQDERETSSKFRVALKMANDDCQTLMRERDKLMLQCKELRDRIADGVAKTRFLQSQQEYFRETLMAKDAQVEKFHKMRRAVWIRS